MSWDSELSKLKEGKAKREFEILRKQGAWKFFCNTQIIQKKYEPLKKVKTKSRLPILLELKKTKKTLNHRNIYIPKIPKWACKEYIESHTPKLTAPIKFQSKTCVECQQNLTLGMVCIDCLKSECQSQIRELYFVRISRWVDTELVISKIYTRLGFHRVNKNNNKGYMPINSKYTGFYCKINPHLLNHYLKQFRFENNLWEYSKVELTNAVKLYVQNRLVNDGMSPKNKVFENNYELDGIHIRVKVFGDKMI